MDNPLQSYLTAAFGNSGMPDMFQNAFSGTQQNPSLLSGGSSGNGMVGGLADLYNNYQSSNNANAINNQVQGINGAQQSAIQNQITAMQQQAAQQRATAMDAYNAAKTQYGGMNTGLQGNIDTMTGNLNALNDPNSPYMQQARQAIERKDAAAGRRSQWGERETQLAGTLADYVGKYAPGLNNSITAARDEMVKNNTSLANMYENMNKVGGITDTNITALINAMNGASTNANTTGRQAATASNNATNALVQSGMSGAGGLIKALMGSLGGSSGGGTNLYSGDAAAYNNGNYSPWGTVAPQDPSIWGPYGGGAPAVTDWGNYSGGGYNGYTTGGNTTDYYSNE